MRVRMIQHLSGTSEALLPGVVYDRPEAEANRLGEPSAVDLSKAES